ncbi:MAG TPA: sortase [Methylomirabilota bacterium]|nr:sortase [Methylomirabilota bacterium]
MKTFSYILIIFGLLWCLLGGYYWWLTNNPNRLEFTNYSAPKTKTVTTTKGASLPERISILDLKISLPVYPAQIRDNKWDTITDGASYLSSSPIPGTVGNSIMYAHDWASLFGNLVYAKPGQKVDVSYADGSHKTFVIEYTSKVNPSESSILAPSKDKRMTLYTCTGFMDSQRFVVVALLHDTPTFAAITKP